MFSVRVHKKDHCESAISSSLIKINVAFNYYFEGIFTVSMHLPGKSNAQMLQSAIGTTRVNIFIEIGLLTNRTQYTKKKKNEIENKRAGEREEKSALTYVMLIIKYKKKNNERKEASYLMEESGRLPFKSANRKNHTTSVTIVV